MGLVLGIILAIGLPESVPLIRVFGDLFVKALKSVAPVLVFFLVINAIAQKKPSQGGNMNLLRFHRGGYLFFPLPHIPGPGHGVCRF